MKGFEVSFKVFANTQEEANKASEVLRKFVDDNARQGIAVTANKLVEAVSKFGNNVFVNSYLKK